MLLACCASGELFAFARGGGVAGLAVGRDRMSGVVATKEVSKVQELISKKTVSRCGGGCCVD